jgi:D-alanyl-D-alanine carboxypeptidase
MEQATNVRIASISKIFTAVVVLQLIEEGVIDLDAPLSAYLPDLLPNGDQIRVRDLLQHTTGLYDYLEDRNYAGRAYQDPQRAFDPRELVQYAAQFPLLFAPASPGNWDYASTNYVILGMIVERVTGNPLAAEMRARIFEPLGLDGTYFTPDEAVPDTMSRGYAQGIDQTNVAMSFGFATANLVSTAGDVRRFIEAVVGGELLGPEMQAEMFTFVNGKGQYNMPALEYGLGLMRNVLPVGQGRPPDASTAVGHIGGFGGFRSATWAAEDGSIAIALGVNQASTDPNILATRVWDAILAHQGR